MIRIRHPQGVATFPVDQGKTTLADLAEFVAPLMGGYTAGEIWRRVEVRTGYPPKVINLESVPPETVLTDAPLSLKRGDQVVLALKASSSGAVPATAAAAATTSSNSFPSSSSKPPVPGSNGARSADGSAVPSLARPQPPAVAAAAAAPSSSSPSSASNSGQKSKTAAVKDAEVFVPVGTTGEFLTLKVAPDDNSCLFHAVGLVLKQTMGAEISAELRQIVATAIRNNPIEYDEATLGMAPEQYIKKILRPNTWGGALELAILAAHFQTELISLDVSSGVVYRFGEGSGYPSCGYLVHSGIHYDALALLPSPEAPVEFGRTLFETADEATQGATSQEHPTESGGRAVGEAARIIVQRLKERHYHTDTSSFTLACATCGKRFVGEREATQHAGETGHTDFREADT
ncbi:unnamed protein product [Parajaminaea phylloscopi]